MLETSCKPFQPTLLNSALQRFGLSLKSSLPCKALTGIVYSYLQIKATRPTPYPIIPDGTQAIFISPGGSRIGGAQSRSCDIQILQKGEYFGIWFYPAALRYFFKLNISEITNQFVDSHYIPCHKFIGIHEQIYQQQDFKKRAAICEHWLLKNYKTQPTSEFDHTLDLICQSFGNIKVSNLAKSAGWSSRHLNRLFKLHTGLSTKTFAQTIRLQQACKSLYTQPTHSAKIANDLGYFDQSHLIKEWNHFLSSSPNTFFKRFKSDYYNN